MGALDRENTYEAKGAENVEDLKDEKAVKKRVRRNLKTLNGIVDKSVNVMTKPFKKKEKFSDSTKEAKSNKSEIGPDDNTGRFTDIQDSDKALLRAKLNKNSFNIDAYSIQKEVLEGGDTLYRFEEQMEVDGQKISAVFYLRNVIDGKVSNAFFVPSQVKDKIYNTETGRRECATVQNPCYLDGDGVSYKNYDDSSIIMEDVVYDVPRYAGTIEKVLTEDLTPQYNQEKTVNHLNDMINKLTKNFGGLEALAPKNIVIPDDFLNPENKDKLFYFKTPNSDHSYEDSFMCDINLQSHIKDNLKFGNVEIDGANIRLPITFGPEKNRQEVGEIHFTLKNNKLTFVDQKIVLNIEGTGMEVQVNKSDKNLSLQFTNTGDYIKKSMNNFVDAYRAYAEQGNNNTGSKNTKYYAGEKNGTKTGRDMMYPGSVIDEWFMFEKQEISEKGEKIGNSFIFENGFIKDIYGKDLSETGVFINDKLGFVHYKVDKSNSTFKNQEYRDRHVEEYRTLSFIIDGKDQTRTFQGEYQEDGVDTNTNFILKGKRGEKRGEIFVNWTPQVDDENKTFTKKPGYEVPAEENQIKFSEMVMDGSDEIYNSIKASFYAKLKKDFTRSVDRSSYNEQKIQKLFDTELEKIKDKIKDFPGVILDGKVYEAKFKGNVVELTETIPSEIQKLIEKINAFCSKVNDLADNLKITYEDGDLGDKNNGGNGIGKKLSLENLDGGFDENDPFTLNCKLTNNDDVEATLQFLYKKGKFEISDTTVENPDEDNKNVIEFNGSYYYYSYDNKYTVTLKRPSGKDYFKE